MAQKTKAQLVKEVAALKRQNKLLKRAVVSATVVANETVVGKVYEAEYPRLAELLGRIR